MRLVKQFEFKSLKESGEFEGVASVYDLIDHDNDVVVAGAFTESIDAWRAKGKLPPFIWHHRLHEPLGPLTGIAEEKDGLYIAGQFLLDAGPRVREAYAFAKAKVTTGLSIGYWPRIEAWDRDRDCNILEKVDLQEISQVTLASNELAQLTAVKSIKTKRDFEKCLRDAGFSRRQALAITADGYKGLTLPRDTAAGEAEAIQGLLSAMRG